MVFGDSAVLELDDFMVLLPVSGRGPPAGIRQWPLVAGLAEDGS